MSPELVEISNEIRAVILTAFEMEQKNDSHGAYSIDAAVRGADNQKTRDYYLDDLSTFGILSGITSQYALFIIEYALSRGWLKRTNYSDDFTSEIIPTVDGKKLLTNPRQVLTSTLPNIKQFRKRKRQIADVRRV